ncbi:MAG: PH domain-containing protein [Methanothrix sp.]|nr:PH domain-containing protein [Methanothrix sp.]
MSQETQSEACMAKVKEILTSDESVIFSVAQTSIAGLKPDTVVLTNKRFILYHPGLLGCKFDEFLWRDLINVKLNEGIMGAKLTFEAKNNKISVDKLPKTEARKAYSIAQEKEQEANETRRQRQMQEDSAKAGHIVVGNVGAGTHPAAMADDPMAKLTKLKNMFDAGLITQDEYDKKKADILAAM